MQPENVAIGIGRVVERCDEVLEGAAGLYGRIVRQLLGAVECLEGDVRNVPAW